MGTAVRKFIVKLIYSNRFTRAFWRRLVWDERSLTDLFTSSRVRHIIHTQPRVRKPFLGLVRDSQVTVTNATSDTLFAEPGLATLRQVIRDERFVEVLYSERPLFRKILRSSEHREIVADELAQYGPLMKDTLLSPRGQKALQNYFSAHKDRGEVITEAKMLLETFRLSGVLQTALANDGRLAEAVYKLLPADLRAGKNGRVDEVQQFRDALEKMRAVGPAGQEALGDILHREWIFGILGKNQDWWRRFIQQPQVLNKALEWDGFAVAFLSDERVLSRLAENGFLMDRLFQRDSARKMLLSLPSVWQAMASDPGFVDVLAGHPDLCRKLCEVQEGRDGFDEIGAETIASGAEENAGESGRGSR